MFVHLVSYWAKIFISTLLSLETTKIVKVKFARKQNFESYKGFQEEINQLGNGANFERLAPKLDIVVIEDFLKQILN